MARLSHPTPVTAGVPANLASDRRPASRRDDKETRPLVVVSGGINSALLAALASIKFDGHEVVVVDGLTERGHGNPLYKELLSSLISRGYNVGEVQTGFVIQKKDISPGGLDNEPDTPPRSMPDIAQALDEFLQTDCKITVPEMRHLAARQILQIISAAQSGDLREAQTKATAQEAGHETTARAKGEPRPQLRGRKVDDDLKSKLERLEAKAVKIGDGTLLSLIARYKAQRNVTLPPDGVRITEPEQAKAAAGLHSTFKNLQARLTQHGLRPLPRDERVLKAQRQSAAFYRNRKTATSAHDHV